jgi:hypothetical protein
LRLSKRGAARTQSRKRRAEYNAPIVNVEPEQESDMQFQWWMFVIGAVLSWGIYVPVLHQGQAKMGGVDGPGGGAIRAFLCVGIAYFITAVVIPLLALQFGWAAPEKLEFSDSQGNLKSSAIMFSTLGGIAGAAGALCIIFSMKFGGTPLYVPPLVFAGAPIVNAIVSVIWHWKPSYSHPDLRGGWMLFGAGILLAAVGAGLVLYSKGSLDAADRELQKQAKASAAAAAVVAQAPVLDTGIKAGDAGVK